MLDETVLGWEKVRPLDELSPGTQPDAGFNESWLLPGIFN